MSKLIEQTREIANFIDRSLQDYDQITEGLLTIRAQYEMVSRDAHLGRMQDPRTGAAVIVSTNDLAEQMQSLWKRRAVVESMLETTLNQDSLNDVRLLRFQLGHFVDTLGALVALQYTLHHRDTLPVEAAKPFVEAVKLPVISVYFEDGEYDLLLDNVGEEIRSALTSLEALLSQIGFDPTLPPRPSSGMILQ
jgi:hypothetical protein